MLLHLSLALRSSLVNLLQIEPALEAADFRFVRHEFAKYMPRLVAVNVHKSAELFVLLGRPHDLCSWSFALASSFLAEQGQVVRRAVILQRTLLLTAQLQAFFNLH